MLPGVPDVKALVHHRSQVTAPPKCSSPPAPQRPRQLLDPRAAGVWAPGRWPAGPPLPACARGHCCRAGVPGHSTHHHRGGSSPRRGTRQLAQGSSQASSRSSSRAPVAGSGAGWRGSEGHSSAKPDSRSATIQRWRLAPLSGMASGSATGHRATGTWVRSSAGNRQPTVPTCAPVTTTSADPAAPSMQEQPAVRRPPCGGLAATSWGAKPATARPPRRADDPRKVPGTPRWPAPTSWHCARIHRWHRARRGHEFMRNSRLSAPLVIPRTKHRPTVPALGR